jgi:hydrogenase nickel incorporation protein HypA/HybF
MHEASLVTDMIARLAALRREHGSLAGVTVRLGALSSISPAHFREHFEHATRGTDLEGIRLEVETDHDIRDPRAQEIILESVEVEA